MLVAEAVAAGWTCVTQFVPDGGADAAVDGAGEVVELAPGVFERAASTQHPQAPMAIVAMPAHDAAEVLQAADFVVVLDRISDPGNLGTILRSAEAAGVDAVVLTPGSVDPYNPKVVRASAGALFHVPGRRRRRSTTWPRAGFLLAGRAATSSRVARSSSTRPPTSRVGSRS